MPDTAGLRPLLVSFVAVAVVVLPVRAGITYRVSAVSESATLSLPDRSQLPPDLQSPESGARTQPRPSARRTKGTPISLTAKVTVQGSNVKIDDYLLDTGGGRRVSGEYFLSSDGGATFDIVDLERHTRRRFPLEMSLNPAAITMKAFSDRLGMRPANLRISPVSTRDGGLIHGLKTQRHRVRISFNVPPDERFRRNRMSATTTLEVWTTNDVPERIAPGMHAWATGFQSVDDELRRAIADITGFPLRVVSEMELGQAEGRQRTVSKLEVTEVEVKPVAASTFAVPE